MEYKALPFQLPSQLIHYIFFKKHISKGNQETPEERTLFITNIPLATSDPSKLLKDLFSGCGQVATVKFNAFEHELRTDAYFVLDPKDSKMKELSWKMLSPSLHAHLVFRKKSDLQKALKLESFSKETENNGTKTSKKDKKKQKVEEIESDEEIEDEKNKELPDENITPPIMERGLKKYIAEYHRSRPDAAVLQAQVDSFMTEFDIKTEEEKKEKVVSGSKPDADGFTLVTRGKKAYKESSEEQDLSKKKKKELHLTDFYKFQKKTSQERRTSHITKEV